MKYKIHYEPMYEEECVHIIKSIVSGTSIKDEMEESIEKRDAESIRQPVEAVFQKPLQLEKYMRENINLNLPGYEENGTRMAAFLFKNWAQSDNAPVDAFRIHKVMQTANAGSKAAAIIFTIDYNYFDKNVYDLSKIEADLPPPHIDDAGFFRLVNNTHLSHEGKLVALELLHDFDTYHAYANALLSHAEELLMAHIGGRATSEIKAFMDTLEKEYLCDNAANWRDKTGFMPGPETIYDIYPGIYKTNSISLTDPLVKQLNPYVIVGVGTMQLHEIYDNADSSNEKASQFLKCLSDGTKQAILQLLKNEPMYGGQLAEKLNCSSANISQHMSVLGNLGVIRYKKENNRLYFELNKEAIHKYLDAAKGIFG